MTDELRYEDDLGSSVVNGEPQFTSVSALELIGRCARSWWYRYIDGRREPENASQQRGVDGHAGAESYLKTGEVPVDCKLLLPGLHLLPKPGAGGFLVEHPIHDREDVTRSALTADGIPVIGKVDLVHALELNHGGEDVLEVRDPPGTVEVADHKFPGSMKYAKLAVELPETIQMAGYGEWVFRTFPFATSVRLSHNYFPVKGRPKKSTIRVDRATVARTWETKVEPLGRLIRITAKRKTAEEVPANTDACGDYGGCPHLEVCKARMEIPDALDAFLGRTGAKRVADEINGEDTTNVSIISRIGVQNGAGNQQNPPPAIDPQIAIETAKLKADEAAAVAARSLPTQFAQVCAAIEASGGGFPQVAGEAAQAVAILRGWQWSPNTGYAGGGALGGLPPMTSVQQLYDLANLLADPAKANALAASLAQRAAVPTPPAFAHPGAVAPLFPPAQSFHAPAPQVQRVEADTPQGFGIVSNATQTASSIMNTTAFAAPQTNVQRVDPPIAVTVANATPPAAIANMFSMMAPETPPSDPKLATTGAPQGPTPAPAGDISQVVAEKDAPKKRGPKKKADASTEGAVILLVNIKPLCEHESLLPYLDKWLEVLEREYQTPDIRWASTDKDHPSYRLAFNGWKGAERALVRAQKLPPGIYTLETNGDEVREIAADAMRAVCEASGGWWARGTL